MGNRPIVIGHRGNSGEAPMNTLISIQQAIEMGADMVEVDVRLSADGVPVLMHNSTVDETTNGTGRVSEMTLNQLKKLDAGSWKSPKYAGEKIPTLAEALSLGRGKLDFSLDVKEVDVIPSMLKTVSELDMRNQTVICGCYSEHARIIKGIDPDFTVLLNLPPDLEKLAKDGRYKEFVWAYVSEARSSGLPCLNVNQKYVTSEFVETAHKQALAVWTFTVDEPERMTQLISIGVDAIYSNYPRKLIDVIEQC